MVIPRVPSDDILGINAMLADTEDEDDEAEEPPGEEGLSGEEALSDQVVSHSDYHILLYKMMQSFYKMMQSFYKMMQSLTK